MNESPQRQGRIVVPGKTETTHRARGRQDAGVHPGGRITQGRARQAWLALICIALLFIWYFKICALAYYWVSTRTAAHAGEDSGVGLAGYRVTIEALPIPGIARNASDLTYNPHTGTLFAVTNSPPQIAEITTAGELLRLIPVSGVADPEGICFVRDDIYIIADERTNRLHWVRIDAATSFASTDAAAHLQLDVDAKRNQGLEGVAWDESGDRLILVKEKAPLRAFVVGGLQRAFDGGGFDISIREWKPSYALSLLMKDLSAVALQARTGNVLLMSDESGLIVEYSPDGNPVGFMPLWEGFHGLTRSVPQAEGMALGPDGALYVLSEPNLFYRFEPVRQPFPARSAQP